VTFAHPLRLVLAVVVLAACAFVYRTAERRKAAQALAYSNVAFALAAPTSSVRERCWSRSPGRASRLACPRRTARS
jgi:cbb3-type cytochrome oxidase subunit 3